MNITTLLEDVYNAIRTTARQADAASEDGYPEAAAKYSAQREALCGAYAAIAEVFPQARQFTHHRADSLAEWLDPVVHALNDTRVAGVASLGVVTSSLTGEPSRRPLAATSRDHAAGDPRSRESRLRPGQRTARPR